MNLRRGWRAARSITALALITLFVASSSVQAGPIVINQVSQTVNTYQGTTDLRINTLGQTQGVLIAKGGAPADGPRNDTKGTVQRGDGPSSLDALLSFPFVSDPQKLGVDYVEEAEVEGSVCDCGDIPPLVGGFPKWPLLFLAAVPLAFIHTCDDCNNDTTPTPTPTPPTTPTPTPPPATPTPTPVPEPASLLLLGTGLLAAGAGLRRRYGKTKLNGETATTREDD